jgi:hypothetical protein
MEAVSNGPSVARTLVRVFASTRPMLEATDTEESPWHIVRSDDKKRARLNCISDILARIPYKRVRRPKVKLPTRSKKHAYDDIASMKDRRWIEEKF